MLLHLVCERLRQRRRQSASELGSGAEADGERDHAVVGGRGGVIGKESPKRLRGRGIPRLTQGIRSLRNQGREIQCSEIMQPEFSGSDSHRGGQGRSESARQTTAFAPESAIQLTSGCCTAGCADQNRAESIDQTSATTETLAKCAQ